jgi:hypothetical protein
VGAGHRVAVGGEESPEHIVGGEAKEEGGGARGVGLGAGWRVGRRESGGGGHGVILRSRNKAACVCVGVEKERIRQWCDEGGLYLGVNL